MYTYFIIPSAAVHVVAENIWNTVAIFNECMRRDFLYMYENIVNVSISLHLVDKKLVMCVCVIIFMCYLALGT